MLEEDEVAFLESLEPLEVASGLRKIADVLVPHDERRAAQRQLVLTDVRATHARNLHFQQRSGGWNVRQGEFAKLGGRGSDRYCSEGSSRCGHPADLSRH